MNEITEKCMLFLIAQLVVLVVVFRMVKHAVDYVIERERKKKEKRRQIENRIGFNVLVVILLLLAIYISR